MLYYIYIYIMLYITLYKSTLSSDIMVILKGIEQEFTTECVKDFSTNKKDRTYYYHYTVWGKYIPDCPNVLVFDPLMDKEVKLFCPLHKARLKQTGLYTSRQIKRHQPRILYAYSRNTLLVSGIYRCQYCSAEYLSHDFMLIDQLPNLFVPFKLGHDSGFLNEAHSMVISSIACGLSFTGAEELFKRGYQTTWNYHHVQGPGSSPATETAFRSPGRRLVRDIFVQHMSKLRGYQDMQLKSYEPSSLSIDATFKIA